MASRSHVDLRSTSEVVERRLRPVYDCLDNGNNKKAIQEADKVLKKQKDLQCAKVLKSLALLRLGRHDESSMLLQDVHGQHPTDDPTLQAMAICYREIHKLELIADMYKNAHKSRPDSEDILTSLFMSYVRLGDYKQQQQTAMLLHKLKPHKNPYYFWAVMSIVMQAHTSPDKTLSRNMFLPLAERMTKKFVDDDKIEAEAEVQLYLIILELLEKWEDALAVVEGPLGERLVSELQFRETKAAEFYTKLGRWPETNTAYRKLLKTNSDHIAWWKLYVQSAVQLHKSEWHPDKDSDNSDIVDYSVDLALLFIQDSISDVYKNGRPQRGPYLAHLELILQYQESCGSVTRAIGDPVHMLEKYFDMFGDRFCCYGDIKAYLTILTEEEKTRLLDVLNSKVQQRTEEGSIIYPDDMKTMQRHVTVLQISRCIGCHDQLTAEEKISLAKELVDRHKQGLQFGAELLPTDLQYCDTYLLLAAHLLLDGSQIQEWRGLVWQAIILLEMGLRNSPSSFQMKLVLIRLYCTMGAFGPCPALYDGMEIKHIMNDTLGHIVSNHVGRLGHFMAACAMYGTMLRFFTVNHKETTEYLIASYKYGSFTKIHEFVKFRERLQNSLQYASATAERMLLDMVLETNSHVSTEQMVMYMEVDPAEDKTDYEQLCDNRDFSVMASWEAGDKFVMADVQAASFKEEVAWLKVRNLTLRILAASVMLGQEIDHDHQANNGLTNGGKKPIPDVLSELHQQLADHLTACQCFTQEGKYPIQGPFRTRLAPYLQGNFHQLFLEMLDNVNYVHSLQEINIDKINNEKEESLKCRVPNIAKEMLEKYKCSLLPDSNDKTSMNADTLENLVLCSETLSHVCVLVGVCYRMLKPVKTVLARRNKKKKGKPIPMPCTFENFNALVSGLEGVCRDLHTVVLAIDPVFLSEDLSAMRITEPLCPGGETDEARKRREEVEMVEAEQQWQCKSVEDHDRMLKEYIDETEKEMWKKVERSYQQSVVEVNEFLHKKLQYLNSLHL